MVTIVDLQLPAAETAMATAFDHLSSLQCEMEEVVASDTYGLWIDGAERSAIDAALAADPTVASRSLISATDRRWLYDLEFAEDVTDRLAPLWETGSVLAASGTNGTWRFRLRFVERNDASLVYERLRERGVAPEIVRLCDGSEFRTSELGLTDDQQEALTAALNLGYFEIPREITMQELADELDISHQALSERLRRAYRTLVDAELDLDRSAPSSSKSTEPVIQKSSPSIT